MNPEPRTSNCDLLHGVPAPAADWMDVLQQASAAVRQLRRCLRRLAADQELTDTELSTLWSCATRPVHGVAQIEIAEQIGASTAQTSALVEKLRERGWLLDHRDAGDRRRRLWTISPSGRAVLEQVLHSLENCLVSSEQVSVFAPASAGQLVELISQWSSATIAGAASAAVAPTDRREAA